MANFKAKKAGLALHNQKKTELKYNEEEALGTPKRIIEWINVILKGEHEQCTGSPTWRRLHFYFRDGTALCKFVNKLREAAGMSVVKFQKNALTPFIAKENMDIFNKAACEYGLPEELMFQSNDLYDCQTKGVFLNIINCLNKLGSVANEKGFTPQYEFVEAPQREEENNI